MRMTDIIEKKKIKEELSEEEIQFFIDGFCKGEIPDYQVSALLMAIRLNGMSEKEFLSSVEKSLSSGESGSFG